MKRGDARARVRAAQDLMAAFLGSREVESEVRADPDAAAERWGVNPEWVARLARIEPGRVIAFRRSMAHKAEVRAGKAPTRLSPKAPPG